MFSIKRRDFILLMGGAAAAWPLSARAQPERMRRIGVLMTLKESDPEARAWVATLKEGLQKLGWEQDLNVRIDYRWSAGDPDRIRTFAAELVALAPDVILCSGAPTTTVLQRATHTVPIVFVQVADPVGSGLVPTLERRGGNITGFTHFEYAIIGKWLEALKETAPGISRVLTIQNPENFAWPGWFRAASLAAASVGVTLTPGEVRDREDIKRTISAHAQGSNGGMIVLPDTTTSLNRKQIIALAAHYRIPAIYPFRFFVTDGGLISYGSDPLDLWRRSASYVDRIIRGESAGDLPVQAPTKFELVINLKTAKALDLTVPPMLLARADEVIE
jgi:putative tryptophan/tyrosine transport system substrate-binding protein